MRHALVLVSLLAALASTPPVFAADDPVVAIVNGEQITRGQLEAAKASLPEQFRELPLPTIFEPLLSRVIDQKLLAEAAEQQKLGEEPTVRAELQRAREQVLQAEIVERAIATGTTQDRLEQAYAALRGQPGFAQEEVHARHILVADEAVARKLLGELAAGGDFTGLAKANSSDPSAQTNAGDLGWFTRDMMVPEFAEAAFTIEPGTIGKEPVRSQFGWHVIRVEERRTKVPSFAEKEPELREQVAREIVTALLADMRGGATIQRFNLDGTPAAN